MKLAVGADHAGFALKQFLTGQLAAAGIELLDLGTHEETSSDYPDFAAAVAQAVQRGEAERGLVLCGSGVGAAMTANKFKGIRAGLCHDAFSARQGVEHDDMNVLCLGGRIIGTALGWDLVQAFLGAVYDGKDSHQRRLDKLAAIEASNFQ